MQRIMVAGPLLPLTDPAEIGQVALWLDPYASNTLFQDSTGLTPVTADGQSVGKWLDRSGRNCHASQSNNSLRPVFRSSGGLKWVESNGSQYLSVSPVTSVIRSSFIAFRPAAQITPATSGTNITGSNGGTGICSVGGYTGAFANEILGGGIGSDIGQRWATALGGGNITAAEHLYTHRDVGASVSDQRIRYDGVDQTMLTQAGNSRANGIDFIFAAGAASVFSGRIYQLLLYEDLINAGPDLSRAETMVGGKAGMTI